MSQSSQYNWVDFYKEFANKLLSYKNNRQELISKVRSIYEEININLPKLEKDNLRKHLMKLVKWLVFMVKTS